MIYIELTEAGYELYDRLSGFKYSFISEVLEGMDENTKEIFRAQLNKAVEKATKMSV